MSRCEMMHHYKTISDDALALNVAFDPELIDEAPDPIYPWLLWSFLKLKNPTPEGVWNEGEADALNVLMDTLFEALEKRDIIIAGYRVQEGWLEIYCYATQAKQFENSVASVIKPYAYMYETGARRDPSWECYLQTLYPNTQTQLDIQSEETISALEAEGDDLLQPRDVEHYFFAQTQAQCERVVKVLEAKGFTCKERTHNASEEYAYGIAMVCYDPVDRMHMRMLCRQLLQIATKEHAIYEGWSTILASEVL